MPALCSLLLEVFSLASISGEISETVDWEVSTDPAHEHPYLIGPRNYAEQEIDPIQCSASIGTTEIGVIDMPETPGAQETGWMTARVHTLRGRRCRLRRYIDSSIGWVTIADGPAGFPRMDPSFSAYRWSIRDTRETERKLAAFNVGGSSGIVPRGPMYGFGRTTDEYAGEEFLLPRVIDMSLVGKYQILPAGDLLYGIVNLAEHFTGGDPATVDDPRLLMDDDGVAACQISEIAADMLAARNADALWRLPGESQWNIARMVAPSSFPQPFLGTVDVDDGEGNTVPAANYVTLWVGEAVPEGFPEESDIDMEVIIRYRGPASEAFPYYVDDTLGEVLKALYRGKYSKAPSDDLGGELYDPGNLDAGASDFVSRIQFDPVAFDALLERVLLRQTSPVDDVRAWAEKMLYGPSGWMPTLDSELKISPISRSTPTSSDSALTLDDSVTVPGTDWQTGERTVSEVKYTYPRYYIPLDPLVEIAPDGLATREVEISWRDRDSEVNYGTQVEEYDASAFAAIGTEEGLNIPGNVEQANLLSQLAKFDVLDRYRAGAQSVRVSARRHRVPFVRVGDWVPWSLMHLPSRLTGLRGSDVAAAQIIAMRDDDCVWRTMTLEESVISDGPPGFASSLEAIGDDPGAGEGSLIVLSDIESP